jgi:hypothetical protein
MNKKLSLATKFTSAIIPIGLYFVTAKNALAVEVGVCIPKAGGGEICTFNGYTSYVKSFYGFTITLGASLAALMIVYSGYMYLVSQGDTTKLNKAKEIFTGAFLGFLLLLTISAILNWIGLPAFK